MWWHPLCFALQFLTAIAPQIDPARNPVQLGVLFVAKMPSSCHPGHVFLPQHIFSPSASVCALLQGRLFDEDASVRLNDGVALIDGWVCGDLLPVDLAKLVLETDPRELS